MRYIDRLVVIAHKYHRSGQHGAMLRRRGWKRYLALARIWTAYQVPWCVDHLTEKLNAEDILDHATMLSD